MSKNPLRIGTRSSPLALWQAHWVQALLQEKDIASELVLIQSHGDQDSRQPLYEMNIQGIFTKALDTALLNNLIDIAVHSYKDVPTQLPEGISKLAVLKRGNPTDLLVYKTNESQWSENATIGTSSLRRSAQWKHRYPMHQTAILRGNVQKRLETLEANDWVGALFAQAGLERVNSRPPQSKPLDWMIPAPAQGAVCVVARGADLESLSVAAQLECSNTFMATQQERIFLRLLEGGCTAPIGALMQPTQEGWYFKGGVFSLDGTEKALFEKHFSKDAWERIGEEAAQAVLKEGGAAIMSQIKKA
jgi:hydroxymethylbilane synthase